MKKTLGILLVLLCVLIAALIVLRIWGIAVVSLGTLVRSSATLLVLGGLLVVLLILYGFFFRNGRAAHNRKAGGNVHPKP